MPGGPDNQPSAQKVLPPNPTKTSRTNGKVSNNQPSVQQVIGPTPEKSKNKKPKQGQ